MQDGKDWSWQCERRINSPFDQFDPSAVNANTVVSMPCRKKKEQARICSDEYPPALVSQQTVTLVGHILSFQHPCS